MEEMKDKEHQCHYCENFINKKNYNNIVYYHNDLEKELDYITCSDSCTKGAVQWFDLCLCPLKFRPLRTVLEVKNIVDEAGFRSVLGNLDD